MFSQNTLFNSGTIIAIADTSIKNNIVTAVSHIFSNCGKLSKKVHHAVNVTTTEAELFAIRSTINQSCQVTNANKIIIITDAIYAAKKIFDSLAHPYQLQAIKAAQCLRNFFNKDPNNMVEFWECPRKLAWPPHVEVDKETRQHLFIPQFPYKNSWDYSKKEECDGIICSWQMMFQASEYKGRNFLKLLDDEGHLTSPTYTKGGAWLKHFSHESHYEPCSHRRILPLLLPQRIIPVPKQ